MISLKRLLLSLVMLLLCSCADRSRERISPYYDLEIIRYTMGDTSVSVNLLGYDNPERKGRPVVLSERVSPLVGIFDSTRGKKILFTALVKEGSSYIGRAFVCADGRTVRDVSEIITQIGHKTGKIGPKAQFGRDYIFKGVQTEPNWLKVSLEWYRGDAGPMTDGVEVVWTDLN